MIPVDMTTKHEPPDSVGDCFPCCVASILELPRADVPHIYEGEGWLDESGEVGLKRLQDWLATRGLYWIEIRVTKSEFPSWIRFLDCHYVLSGISPRGHRHATVWFGGEMAHDPHPSRGGVEPDDGCYSLGFLVKR